MKRFVMGLVAASFSIFLLASYCSAQETKTFKGEITDANLNCVQTPMKAPPDVKGNEQCVLYWTFWHGEKYVLYDAATKTAYQLADQDKIVPYIAETVVVTGTEDNNKTIKVTEIKKAGGKS